MKYLLDVNALLAWWHPTHVSHPCFHVWGKQVGFRSLNTCALVELGFLRVSMQVYRFSLDDAQTALGAIRKRTGGYLADCPPPSLAGWAETAGKTTDAYLCQFALAHGLKLATFDGGIRDTAVLLIPPTGAGKMKFKGEA